MENNEKKQSLPAFIIHNFEFIIAGIFMIIMIVALLAQVIFRFVIRHPLGWTEELAVTSFVMMVYIGSIGATRNDEHMKMEVVLNLLGEKARLVTLIIGDLVFAIVNLILANGLYKVSMNLRKYHMTTAMLHLPKWIPYLVLPICFIAMDIRLVQNILKKVKLIKEADSQKTVSDK